jgi:hypothetical protein
LVDRAEWDLPLHHPEVGIVFLLLTAAGLVTGLLDRRWRKSVWPWLIFGLATCLLVAPYKFRAFRNVLSLVPVACILVALLYARIREKLSRPLWTDLAAALLPVVLFAPALHQYVRYQLTLEDSREQAIRWLAEHTGPRDKILFAEELAFLPSRVASLGVADADVTRWGKARDRIFRRGFRYLVLGELARRTGAASKIPYEVRVWILNNYEVVARFGTHPTSGIAKAFKGNDQIVYVLKRVPRKEPRPTRKRPGVPGSS